MRFIKTLFEIIVELFLYILMFLFIILLPISLAMNGGWVIGILGLLCVVIFIAAVRSR